MATTTIITNQQQIAALVIDDANRTISFEYGGELIEFVYHVTGDSISMPALLGNLQEAITNTGTIAPILQGYISDGTLVADPDNRFPMTDPLWLAVK
jgi:hypothetical protein